MAARSCGFAGERRQRLRDLVAVGGLGHAADDRLSILEYCRGGVVSGQVWGEVRGPLRRARRRRAAIAFAGSSAATVLPLRRGDTIVVNGGDDALASGSTNPDALGAWLAAGVTVRSYPDLHAKVILLESADDSRTVIVGSANASANSRDRLVEAALLIDDRTICDAVSAQLDIWTALGDQVDERWLTRARLFYREPRQPGVPLKPRRVRPDTRKPLWVGTTAPTAEELTAEGELVRRQVARRWGRGADVDVWFLEKGDERTVLPDHNVVLVNNPNEQDEPHGNSAAWAPAIIARVEHGRRGHSPVAFLVRDPDLDRYRFSDVRAAVEGAGGKIDWDTPLPTGPAAAVYALWTSGEEPT